jgi:hypothetical protein
MVGFKQVQSLYSTIPKSRGIYNTDTFMGNYIAHRLTNRWPSRNTINLQFSTFRKGQVDAERVRNVNHIIQDALAYLPAPTKAANRVSLL